MTNPDWAPTLNIERDDDNEQERQHTQERYSRATRRMSMKEDLTAAQALFALQDEQNDSENFEPEVQVHMGTQTPAKHTVEISTQTEMCVADSTSRCWKQKRTIITHSSLRQDTKLLK